jgi:hypothetical protein
MLEITLAWAQLGAGMGYPILEYPSPSLPHLECEWIASIRDGMMMISGSIELIKPFVIP